MIEKFHRSFVGQKLRSIVLLLWSLFLYGCTSGRYYPTPVSENISLQHELTVRESIEHVINNQSIQQCLEPDSNISEHLQNTVFIHPGWRFIIDWGGGRARDAGLLLARDGFAGSVLEVRSRKSAEMYDRILDDSGSRYLGLHYSMGGSPKVLQEALDAAKSASKELDNHIIYSPILVEPYGFSSISEIVELENSHLGNIVVIVSDDYSFLRPNINGASREALEHPKLNFIYAEDFGLNWGHFGFLSDIRKSETKAGLKHDRAVEIFHAVAMLLQANLAPNYVKIFLAHLKVKYAYEDGREVPKAWIDLGINQWGQLSYLCNWEESGRFRP
ncbi:MAG: hypothetical protein ACI9DC_005219 [Gammaproteobacteria bacterium]